MPKGQEIAHTERGVWGSRQKKPYMQTPQTEVELNVFRNWRLLTTWQEKAIKWEMLVEATLPTPTNDLFQNFSEPLVRYC